MSQDANHEDDRLICDPSTTIAPIELFSIILASLLLIFMLIILYISILALNKIEKLDKILKYLFISSIIAHSGYLLSGIGVNIVCQGWYDADREAMVPFSCILFFYYNMLMVLLGTLLIRLYISFDNSIYKIKGCSRYTLNILYFITAIQIIPALGIYVSAIPAKSSVTVQNRISITVYFVGSWFILYMVTATFCICLFAKNMLKITKLNATPSVVNLYITEDKKDEIESTGTIDDMGRERSATELNDQQQRFLAKISRYVSLFTLAIILTFCTAIGSMSLELIPTTFEGKSVQLIIMSGYFDGVLNIICLALQYPFAKEFYYKYCLWVECCWKAIFIRKAEKHQPKKKIKLVVMKSETGTTTHYHESSGSVPGMDIIQENGEWKE